jgi:perosamine synthetase
MLSSNRRVSDGLRPVLHKSDSMMWSRKRIDIGWRDLLFAAWQSLGPGKRLAAQDDAERAWSSPEESTTHHAAAGEFRKFDTLVCLSVRSGFDLLWTELNLPVGSEVLMSAVTIRDMARIVEEHGLVPVPLDLVPSTMAPDENAIRGAITSRTRAIVVAHLFGAIHDLTAVARIAREHNLLLIEDCAQAFDGYRYRGHSASDVVMFSFGPIKTATALAGGLLTVRDPVLLRRMRLRHSEWPVQTQSEFLRRVRTYAMLKLISGRLAFGCLVSACRLLRRDYDSLLNGAVRNFPAEGFFLSLRRQPCAGLLKLLARRIRTFDVLRQDRRAALGKRIVIAIRDGTTGITPVPDGAQTSEALIPSSGEDRHTWWVFPVCLKNAEPLMTSLRESGFDATCGSQLRPIPAPADRPDLNSPNAVAVIRQMMFLPLYPEMPEAAAVKMGQIVARAMTAD